MSRVGGFGCLELVLYGIRKLNLFISDLEVTTLTSTPLSIARPDLGGGEDEVVPEDPAEVVEAQRAKQVDVDRDTGTSGGGDISRLCSNIIDPFRASKPPSTSER